MNYPADMDPLMIPLCDEINKLPDTWTKWSCQGHETSKSGYAMTAYVVVNTLDISVMNMLYEAFNPVRQCCPKPHPDKIGDFNDDNWRAEFSYLVHELQGEKDQDINVLKVCFRRGKFISDEESKKSFSHKIWRIQQLRNYYKI